MKKKLIFEDKKKQEELINIGFRGIKSKANKMKEAYSLLGIGDLDDNIYQNILSRGYSSVEQKMVNDVNEQLSRVNITIPSIKKRAIEDVYQSLNDSKIESAINDFLDGYQVGSMYQQKIQIYPSILKLSDGAFLVNEDQKEELFEQHTRIYIQDEEDQKIWDSLNNLADTINSQNELLKSYHAPVISHHSHSVMSHLFTTHVDKGWLLVVNPQAINIVKGFAETFRTNEQFEKRRAASQKSNSEARERQERELYSGKTAKEWAMADMKEEKAQSKAPATNQDVYVEPTFLDTIIT